jgi:hypothetical protein
VVVALEHLVAAAQVDEIAVAVHRHQVAGAVVAVGEHAGHATAVVGVAGHEPERTAGQVDAQLALSGGRSGVRVEHGHGVPGQRAAHGPWLDRLARRVADRGGHLGLPVAVAHHHPPRPGDLGDDLRGERLARAHGLSQPDVVTPQVALQQRPPHRGGRAEAGHAPGRDRLQKTVR